MGFDTIEINLVKIKEEKIKQSGAEQSQVQLK